MCCNPTEADLGLEIARYQCDEAGGPQFRNFKTQTGDEIQMAADTICIFGGGLSSPTPVVFNSGYYQHRRSNIRNQSEMLSFE
jgi:hypothetical protein